MIPRRYKKLQKPSEKEADQGEYAFEAFFDEHIVVLLGDPGLGKSKSFEMAVAAEPNAEFVTVASFLRTGIERYRGKVLYLDGLDEQRARSDGQGVLDRIVRHLDQLGSPKVRVSCRTADWHDGSDIQALKDVCPTGEIRQVSLLPLNDAEISSLVSERVDDPRAFIAAARQHGVYELLQNPETLNLVADAVSGGHGWPKARRSVFEQAYEVLIHEQNPDHQRTQEEFAEDELMTAAEYLAAICLLSGSEGIALAKRHEAPGFPAIQKLGSKPKVLLAAAKRRVFRSVEPGKITYRHRMVGEFLTAKYLARRIEAGHPISRVLALITGADGGTLSDLRGIYGWLVTLVPGFAADIVPRDPYGAILYGDPASWNLNTCRSALRALEDLEATNPWFRARGWGSRPLAGFGRRELVPDIQAILRARSRSHLAMTVLDFLAASGPLPEMKAFLLDFIQDASQEYHLRDDAVRAFMACCPDDTGELIAILDRIQSGDVLDAEGRVELEIIRSLYPQHLTVEMVAPRLTRLREGRVDASYYLTHQFLKLTGPDEVKVLADILGEAGSDGPRQNSVAWQSFIEELLWRVVKNGIDSETPQRIYGWLGMALAGADYNIVQGKRAERIRGFIRERPELFRQLFEIALAESLASEQNRRLRLYKFSHRVFHCGYPPGFRRYLLGRVAAIEDDEVAAELFGAAIFSVFNPDVEQECTIEEVFDFVDLNPRFAEQLQRYSAWPVNHWEAENAKRRKRTKKRKCITRLKMIRDYKARMDGIRAGTDIGALYHFSQIWKGRYSDLDSEQAPRQRLEDTVGPELFAAAVEGLVSAVKLSANVKTPREILDVHADGRMFHMHHILPVGLRLMDDAGEDVVTLDEGMLTSALVFHHIYGEDDERDLIAKILAAHPAMAREVLRQCWWDRLGRGEDVESYYLLKSDSVYTPVFRSLVLDVVREFPGAKVDLVEPCLVVGLVDHRAELARLLPTVPTAGLPVTNQIVLALAGYVLRPEDFAGRIAPMINSADDAMTLVQFIFRYEEELNTRGWTSPLEKLEIVQAAARALGPLNLDVTHKGATRMRDDIPRYLRDILAAVAVDPSAEVTEKFEQIIAAASDTGWRDEFVHSLAEQRKNRREFEFKYATAEQLVSALTADKPANVADMRATVVHALDDIAEAARNSATDDWKSFWNLDRYGRPVDPRVENICRDELMRHLKVALRHLGIAFASEGRYAEENRSDIDCRYELGRVPIELKRSQHEEVWRAAENQLVTEYCRDRETAGIGVYLVLWFGPEYTTSPADGTAVPATASEMQHRLQKALPASMQYRVVVRCLDVSKPSGRPGRKKSRQKVWAAKKPNVAKKSTAGRKPKTAGNPKSVKKQAEAVKKGFKAAKSVKNSVKKAAKTSVVKSAQKVAKISATPKAAKRSRKPGAKRAAGQTRSRR
jgi:hypothetical protein